jgi:hypothetical protein
MQYEAYHAYDEFEFSRAAAHLLWEFPQGMNAIG